MYDSILSARIATFTVDTAVNDVSVVPDGTAASRFRTPSNNGKFRKKDNVLIRSIAMVFPYCFTQSGDRLSIQILWANPTSGATTPFSEMQDGKIWIFSENVETELNIYWQWKAALGAEANAYFVGVPFQHVDPPATGISYPRISMLNCPAALNGTVQPVFAFIKCRHTLELDAM